MAINGTMRCLLNFLVPRAELACEIEARAIAGID